jgi:hypothetical protein
MVELLDVQFKKAMKLIFILEHIRMYVAKYSEFWPIYVYRVHPHVPSLTTPPPSPHNRVKTSMFKELFKEH